MIGWLLLCLKCVVSKNRIQNNAVPTEEGRDLPYWKSTPCASRYLANGRMIESYWLNGVRSIPSRVSIRGIS
jgi:hypothetical protein